MARLKEIPEAHTEEQTPHAASHEFKGLLLLAAGLVLFLSLISYTPQDLPDWLRSQGAPVSQQTSSHTLNFLGSLGAILAMCVYFVLGSAAYLLCALLLGYGSAKLILSGTRIGKRALWSLVFVASGACLAQVFSLPLIDAHRLNLPGEGGWLGRFLGETILRELFGLIGASALLISLYVVSLLYMTGIRPLEVLEILCLLPAKGKDAFLQWRAERAEALALRQAELEMSADRAARSANLEPSPVPANERKKTRPLTRKVEAAPRLAPCEEPPVEVALKASPPAPPEENLPEPALSVAEAPEPERPAPKIIDSTAPPLPRPKEPRKEKDHTMLAALDCDGYELPSIDLLDPVDLASREAADPAELRALQDVVIDTLLQFGIEVSAGDITRGPTITRYEVYPAKGVRVDRILALERDIARATRAERINILAPIPGKDTVGIEIANSKKQKVTLRELFESDDFSTSKAKIPIALGKDVYGKTIIGDLAGMPHGLVAGTTGSGKSVCINAIIASILYKFTPQELRFIMIDPKVVEMQMYNALPHLVVPVVTDPKKVLLALRWAVDEMEKRYAIFAKTGVRNIASFNDRPKPKSQKELDDERKRLQPELFDAEGNPKVEPPKPAPNAATAEHAPEDGSGALLEPVDLEENIALSHGTDQPPNSPEDEMEPPVEELSSEERITRMTTIKVPRDKELQIPDRMPFIVIIVDELADLMQTAPADVESAIARITQKARAAGIHMIIATQTPRADVITGVIKANVPCRVAFQVASALDSRVILDENGAEKLLGQGDMLYRPPGTSRMIRAQGVLVTDEEVKRLVDFASAQSVPVFENSIHKRLESNGEDGEEDVSDEDEELVEKCLEVIRQEKKASTSLFQRRLRLGYTRAARILDILETRGYVGPGEGIKPREILVDTDRI
ncbi:MAG: S-DNA-T family [Verrucomicrobia bacterium]|nr:MAG: S-DNA-T family [Verrucomicrobiota bacterium]